MRIALYYPWIYLPGGPERTFVELLARSRHQWTLVTNHYDREASFPELKSRRVVELPRVSVKRSLGPVARAAARIATQQLPLEDHDALVIGCDGLGDLALLRNSRLPRPASASPRFAQPSMTITRRATSAATACRRCAARC